MLHVTFRRYVIETVKKIGNLKSSILFFLKLKKMYFHFHVMFCHLMPCDPKYAHIPKVPAHIVSSNIFYARSIKPP